MEVIFIPRTVLHLDLQDYSIHADFFTMMHWLWKVWWLLPGVVITTPQVKQTENKTSPSLLSANISKPRSLAFEDRQDITSYQGYYPYPTYGPPPSYGPPNEIPPGFAEIEFAFDDIVLRCITEEPFEHIVWVRYRCPQQFLFGGEGEHIADGSNVYEHNLYDVHIRGHDGTIISELLIKEPLSDYSEGIYQCEVWPHIHGNGYFPYSPYQNFNPPRSDVFIIGGNSLLEDCYHVNPFGQHINKVPDVNNKGDANGNKDTKIKQNLTAIKPRRNATENRKNNSSKHLRYNLKYVDNTLYNVNGENVTANFFRPMTSIPFRRSFNHNVSQLSEVITPKNNKSVPVFAFSGRSRPNDKFREVFPK